MIEPRVTMADIRALYCARGARKWFAAQGLDFRDFLKNGAPVSVIEGTGDGLGLRVAAYVRNKHERR